MIMRYLVRLWILAVPLVAFAGFSVAFGSAVHRRDEVKDVSGERSPVHISGHIAFSDDAGRVARYSYKVAAAATNVSGKTILLLCVRFRVNDGSAPGLDYAYRKDYFFSQKTLEPDSSEDVLSAPSSVSAPMINGVPIVNGPSTSKPIATAEVEFVQFSDGSTWGDQDAARSALEIRASTMQELRTLESTYTEEGERAFLLELSKQELLPGINSIENICKDRNDEYATCALDMIRKMIATAQSRHG